MSTEPTAFERELENLKFSDFMPKPSERIAVLDIDRANQDKNNLTSHIGVGCNFATLYFKITYKELEKLDRHGSAQRWVMSTDYRLSHDGQYVCYIYFEGAEHDDMHINKEEQATFHHHFLFPRAITAEDLKHLFTFTNKYLQETMLPYIQFSTSDAKNFANSYFISDARLAKLIKEFEGVQPRLSQMLQIPYSITKNLQGMMADPDRSTTMSPVDKIHMLAENIYNAAMEDKKRAKERKEASEGERYKEILKQAREIYIYLIETYHLKPSETRTVLYRLGMIWYLLRENNEIAFQFFSICQSKNALDVMRRKGEILPHFEETPVSEMIPDISFYIDVQMTLGEYICMMTQNHTLEFVRKSEELQSLISKRVFHTINTRLTRLTRLRTLGAPKEPEGVLAPKEPEAGAKSEHKESAEGQGLEVSKESKREKEKEGGQGAQVSKDSEKEKAKAKKKKAKKRAQERKQKAETARASEESYKFVTEAALQTARNAGRASASLSECACPDMPRQIGLENSPRDAMDELAIRWLCKTYPLSKLENKKFKLLFLGEGKCLYLANLMYKLNKLGYGVLALAQDPQYIHFHAMQSGYAERLPTGEVIDKSYKYALDECMAVIKALADKFPVGNGFTHIVECKQLKEDVFKNERFHAIFAVDVNQHLSLALPKIDDARKYLKFDENGLIFASTILNPKTEGAVAKVFVAKRDSKELTAIDSISISITPGKPPVRLQSEPKALLPQFTEVQKQVKAKAVKKSEIPAPKKEDERQRFI